MIITRRDMLISTGAIAAMAAARVRAQENESTAETTPNDRSGNMQITRSGSQPSDKGSAEYFTGLVRVDLLFKAPDPARVNGASVTFEPGARTAWHTHPLGQTLIVTSGRGWAQVWGDETQEIFPGDVVWFPPGEKHWHGATATTGMTHLAIQEALNGKNVEWMEKVTDEQYRARDQCAICGINREKNTE